LNIEIQILCYELNTLCHFVCKVIAEMTNGGVDRAVECTGSIQAMISAFECVHDVCQTLIFCFC